MVIETLIVRVQNGRISRRIGLRQGRGISRLGLRDQAVGRALAPFTVELYALAAFVWAVARFVSACCTALVYVVWAVATVF